MGGGARRSRKFKNKRGGVDGRKQDRRCLLGAMEDKAASAKKTNNINAIGTIGGGRVYTLKVWDGMWKVKEDAWVERPGPWSTQKSI